MQQFIKKWGNGAAVRLPKAIMDEAHLAIDATVELRVEDGRVVIESVQQRKYKLDELVSGITDQNRHGEIDASGPVGNETF